MKFQLTLVASLAVACSSEAQPNEGVAGSGGSPAGSAGMPATGAATFGGASNGGVPPASGAGGSVGGAGGSVGGAGGSVGGGAGSGGSGGAIAVAFDCSQLMGPNVAGEWFAAGFETFVNGDAWQVKAPHHSFVEDWANPDHDVWRENGCQGTYSNCETKSACAGGVAPDRVLFVTQRGDYLEASQAQWETAIGEAVVTIKQKYPSVKRVELLTFVRGPDNSDCGTETTVSPKLDAAQQALAAASSGFISVGPRFEAESCDQFGSAPHLTGAGDTYVGELMGKHYSTP